MVSRMVFTSSSENGCALRRQQPSHQPVFECLSVSSHCHPSSAPLGSWFYGSDNYSDAGAAQNCEIEQLEGGRMKRQPKRPIDVSSMRDSAPRIEFVANLNLAVKTHHEN